MAGIRDCRPLLQSDKLVRIPCHDYLDNWEISLYVVAELSGNVEDQILLFETAFAYSSCIVASVAGVDNDAPNRGIARFAVLGCPCRSRGSLRRCRGCRAGSWTVLYIGCSNFVEVRYVHIRKRENGAPRA